MSRHILTPRRYSTTGGGTVDCAADNADLWTVVEASTAAVVCRCDTEDMGRAVVAGLAAVDEVEALKAEREACRLAACFALGTDPATLEEAIAALCAGYEGKVIALLGGAPTTEQAGSSR